MAQKKRGRYEREHGRRESTRQAVAGIPSTSYDDPGVMQDAEPLRSEPSRIQAGITRAVEPAGGDGRDRSGQPGGRIARAAQKVRGIFTRAKNKITHSEPPHRTPSRGRNKAGDEKAARLVRRETDIPLDELARTYTPTQTSLKASFRADGRDQQSSQEFANGTADNKWSDEDRYTNRSGDPRIGTHGRTYEAAEEDRRSGRE